MLQTSNYKFLEKIYHKNIKKKSKDKYYKKTKLLYKDINNLKILNRDGYCILRGVFSKKFIDNLNSEFQKQIKILKNISLPRDLSKKKNIKYIYLTKI